MRLGKKVKVHEARALTCTLGEWISTNVPKLTSTQLTTAFTKGDVKDAWGTPLSWCTPATVLTHPVYIYLPAADAAATVPHIPVVFRGDGWLVVNKPQGLATMPRGAYVARTATVALRKQENNDNLTPAHRLDRATGGLLLFTSKPELRGLYQELFANRQVQKTYRAAAAPLPTELLQCGTHTLKCEPNFSPAQVVVDPPEMPGWVRVTSRIHKEHGVMAAQIVPGEPNAVTYLRQTAERAQVCGHEFAVYEVRPHTGKTHQIRLHFAALGLPLVGDPLYAGFNAAPVGVDLPPPGFSNLHLTATELRFTDPQTNLPIKIQL